MRSQAHVLLAHAVFVIPVPPLVDPVFKPFIIRAGHAEKLHLHLLELASAENEVTGGDLVSEAFTDLSYSERQFLAGGLLNVDEVYKYPLRGLRPHKDLRAGFLHRAHKSLEHTVELPRLRQLPSARGTLPRAIQIIVSEPLFASLAVYQRVGETLNVAGDFPDARVHQYRGINPYYIIASGDHIPPPCVFYVALKLDSKGAVVPCARQAAIYLAGLKNEPALFAQVYDGIHINH